MQKFCIRAFQLGLTSIVACASTNAQDAGFAAVEQRVDRVADLQVYHQYFAPADPDVAVGTTRIVLVTNGGVEI